MNPPPAIGSAPPLHLQLVKSIGPAAATLWTLHATHIASCAARGELVDILSALFHIAHVLRDTMSYDNCLYVLDDLHLLDALRAAAPLPSHATTPLPPSSARPLAFSAELESPSPATRTDSSAATQPVTSPVPVRGPLVPVASPAPRAPIERCESVDVSVLEVLCAALRGSKTAFIATWRPTEAGPTPPQAATTTFIPLAGLVRRLPNELVASRSLRFVAPDGGAPFGVDDLRGCPGYLAAAAMAVVSAAQKAVLLPPPSSALPLRSKGAEINSGVEFDNDVALRNLVKPRGAPSVSPRRRGQEL